MILKEEIDKIVLNAMLSEERGVAARKYSGVVDEIIRYCNDFISPGSITASLRHILGRGQYKIKIPSKITKKIDFIDGLKLVINLSDMGSDRVSNSGGGWVVFMDKHTDAPGNGEKFPSIEMVIEGFYHNGHVLKRTIENSLYHELNHCYDLWRRKAYKKQKMISDIGIGYRTIDNVSFSPYPSCNEFFHDIFYRLFIPTELNALVSGVYGDLKGMDSERKNYRVDIHDTQAAWVLDNFADNFDKNLENASVDSLMQACKEMDVDGVSMQDAHTFLVTFKQVFEKKMRQAWKGVGRAASLWYDDKEAFEMERNGNKIVVN